MIRVLLNGEEISQKDIAGEQDFTVTIEVEDDEGSVLTKSLSGQVTLYGRAWEIVKTNLIDPPDGLLREVDVEVWETCATPNIRTFKGVFRGDLVDWCEGECFCTCTGVEKTETSAAADCLKSTLVYDNHAGFQTADHPRMTYCDEIRPEWLHHVILTIGVFTMLTIDLLTPVILSVAIIITIVNGAISILNSVPIIPDIPYIDIDGDPNTNTFQEWLNLRNRIRETLIGCGRQHPSPLVRSYIDNVCNKCGIAFQSSILKNPSNEYWNLVLWNATVSKGTRNQSTKYIYDNRPIMSGSVLLDKLRTVFNARYGVRMIAGVPTLVFERKDQMASGSTWVDPMAMLAQNRLIGTICYSWAADNPPAYTEIGFSEDGLDEPGNEARDRYKDEVEWNQPFNAVQRGSKQTQFQFGMLRCRRDGEGVDVLDDYSWFPSLTGPINNHGHAMMVSRGIAGFPKLLIWNGNLNSGEVQRGYDRPGIFKPADSTYNFPMWVSEYGVPPNTAAEPDAPNLNVYGRFHSIDNPKVLGTRGLQFKFEFEYTANDLLTMDPFATIPLPMGSGVITTITINHSKRTILVAGKV